MSWLARLFSGDRPVRTAANALADATMAAARRPGFYLAGLATDDFDGRFSLVALHASLVLRRLRTVQPGGRALAERYGEILFDRFDYAYREEGVGDTTIARKVRKLGERLYGLAGALDSALEADDQGALEAVLARNSLGGQAPARLAEYTRAAESALADAGDGDILAGRMRWPEAGDG